jgi:class 3 adenylate cyclase
VRALKGESATADDAEVHQGDKIIPLEIFATPIYDQQGNIVYAINTLQDITERKEAEAERQKFIEDLFEVNCNLEISLDAELEIAEATSRFVPNEFLAFLGCDSIVDVKLGKAVELEMSVLFSDIRDFTTLSEQMTPTENFKFINSYLSRMEPLIVENQGFIDKYIGDAIMALFSEGADDAVKAGIAMLQTLAEYNRARASLGYVPVQIGVGINTGSLILGIVGGKSRMDGTVISDAVNLASRIESLTKNYGVSLLITQQTFDRLTNPGDYAIRVIDKVQVKGKSEWVTVYEVFDADLAEVKAGKLATLQLFTEALSLYNMKSFRQAAGLFADCLRQNPEDKVARIYWERCN